MNAGQSLTLVNPKELTTDQQVRWCPGCGDFSILTQLKKALTGLGLPREKIVFIGGVGCAGRLPYYMNTYGFHTIHGVAPAVATGLKSARPDLSVWVVMGDGDGVSAGAGHLLHALRRNCDLKILLLNNEVFGLTKGQASPTSRIGTRTHTTPHGSFETPLKPLTLALAAGASFAARTVDVEADHLTEMIQRAALHPGSAFIEILQNCNVFNDGVFEFATDKATKADSTLYLENGKPLLFGKDRTRGIRMNGPTAEAVSVGIGEPLDDVYVHDEGIEDSTAAYMLSRLGFPDFPECFGVFRAVVRPTFEEEIRRHAGPGFAGSLSDFFAAGDTWTIGPKGHR